MAGKRKSTTLPGVTIAAAAVLWAGLLTGCLPEDTRPEPAVVYTDFSLVPSDDTDLADGLSFATDDGYEVTITELYLTLGRVEFRGDDCNMYSQQDLGNFYSRVMDALQPGDQRLATSFALGQCSMHFVMHPPEDWAHVDNPGSSAQLRESLRAVEFPGQQMIDEFAGPRGSKGVSLRVGGVGRPVAGGAGPTPFLFEFGLQTSSGLECGSGEEEFFSLEGGSELTTVVEMLPHHLFGRCGSGDSLAFERIASTEGSGPGGAVVLADLEQVEVPAAQRTWPDGYYFCDPIGQLEKLESDDERQQLIERLEQSAPANVRQGLLLSAAAGLFGVRGGSCSINLDRDE